MVKKRKRNKITNFEELSEAINGFNHNRGWNSLSSDIAKSIVIEAAELLEHFQWDETNYEHKSSLVSSKNKEELGEEVADVFWYLVSFCKREEIDLPSVLYDKLKKNEEKYPVEQFQGKHNPKFYIAQKRKYRENRKKS